MADGCILGECKICGELIWEDESWDFVADNLDEIYHLDCAGIKEYQVEAIELFTNKLQDMKTVISIYQKELAKIEKEIDIKIKELNKYEQESNK